MRFEPSTKDLPQARLVTFGLWPFASVDIVCATNPVYNTKFLNIYIDQNADLTLAYQLILKLNVTKSA
jgi:hypothetical protein